MPTFFARRYMRGKPLRTERVVGFAVLALLALIVLAFLASTGYLGDGLQAKVLQPQARYVMDVPDRPLFRAKPSSLPQPPPPHEEQVAEAMLPGTLGDHRRYKIMVFPLRENEPSPDSDARLTAVLTSAIDYGGAWAYEAVYHRTDRKGTTLFVAIVDAGQPENAFGLWRAREPAGARRLNIARGGWQHAESDLLGFWAGRYYTEVRDLRYHETDPKPAAEMEALARVLAGVQIVYGGPFWAEPVLPAEGQVADSLRYMRRNALGIPALQECWLADYEGGVTLGVIRADEAKRAAILTAVGEQFMKAPTEGEASGDAAAAPPADENASEGYGEGDSSHEAGAEDAAEAGDGESHDAGYGEAHASGDTEAKPQTADQAPQAVAPDARIGFLDGRPATVFAAGPYVFVALGGEMEALNALAARTHARWSARAAESVAQADKPDQTVAVPGQARFADLGDPHLTVPTRIERYTDNLYEKIDGREGQYRAYHVVELRFGQYADTSREQVYDVYLYDMAEPANAMGIYMTERPPAVTLTGLGREGYLSGASAYFWKGRYYVNVLGPAEGDERSTETARKIAGGIAETIADDGQPFRADALLPEEDRVANSLSYKATSALGYDFLERMFLASYETGGKKYQAYLIRTDGPERAAELFGRLVESTARYDKVLHRGASPGGETFVSESLGVFAVGFHAGPYMGGVIECEDRPLAERKAAALRDRVLADAATPQ